MVLVLILVVLGGARLMQTNDIKMFPFLRWQEAKYPFYLGLYLPNGSGAWWCKVMENGARLLQTFPVFSGGKCHFDGRGLT